MAADTTVIFTTYATGSVIVRGTAIGIGGTATPTGTVAVTTSTRLPSHHPPELTETTSTMTTTTVILSMTAIPFTSAAQDGTVPTQCRYRETCVTGIDETATGTCTIVIGIANTTEIATASETRTAIGKRTERGIENGRRIARRARRTKRLAVRTGRKRKRRGRTRISVAEILA